MTLLPPDWQVRMAAVIRGAEAPDPSWFTGGPTVTPAEQIGIYQNQYRLRMFDALATELPGLQHLLGDDADRVFWAYLDANPPHTWTLNRIADRFVAWSETAGLTDAQVDLGALDVAVAASFEAAAGEPLSVEQLAAAPALRLAPHARLLRLRTDVHLYRSAVLTRSEPPPITAMDRPLLVFRRGVRVRHAEVDLPRWTLLSALDAGQDLGTALVSLTTTFPEVAPHLGAWFRDFAERDWLQVRQP